MAMRVLTLLLAGILVALLWSAAEQHYRACIETAHHDAPRAPVVFGPTSEAPSVAAGCPRLPL